MISMFDGEAMAGSLTIAEALNMLPPEIAEKALTNAINTNSIALSWPAKEFKGASAINGPADALTQAFSWHKSPEGSEYWRTIAAELVGGDHILKEKLTALANEMLNPSE